MVPLKLRIIITFKTTLSVWLYIYPPVCSSILVSLCVLGVSMHVHLCVCLFICVCVRVCVCVCVCVCLVICLSARLSVSQRLGT